MDSERRLWQQVRNTHTCHSDLLDAVALLANETGDIDLMLAAMRLWKCKTRTLMAERLARSSAHPLAQQLAEALLGQ